MISYSISFIFVLHLIIKQNNVTFFSVNTKDLSISQKGLFDDINTHAKDLGFNDTEIMPILDGVCDIKAYLSSSPKVMWILKEPNGQNADGSLEEGGWSIPDEAFIKLADTARQPTWQKIIYVMYGYLNGYKYDDMDYISNQLEMAKVMQCIAYINVSKMPAPPISTPSHVRRCYNQWKPILYKQIETYTPDVIIFGNTFAHFRHDFEKCGLEVLEGFPGWVDIYKCRDRFLFDAYHPLQRKGDKAYINTLIDSLNMYFPQIKTNTTK